MEIVVKINEYEASTVLDDDLVIARNPFGFIETNDQIIGVVIDALTTQILNDTAADECKYAD